MNPYPSSIVAFNRIIIFSRQIDESFSFLYKLLIEYYIISQRSTYLLINLHKIQTDLSRTNLGDSADEYCLRRKIDTISDKFPIRRNIQIYRTSRVNKLFLHTAIVQSSKATKKAQSIFSVLRPV